MPKTTLKIFAVTAAIVLMGAGCSSKKTTTNTTTTNTNTAITNTVVQPSGNTTGDFSTSTNTAIKAETVTITAAGVSPKTLTITSGTAVTFINTDTIAHKIASDPHPGHTILPAFDNTSGRTSYVFTFTKVGSFGYHDHLDPTNTSLQGTIIVQ